MPDPEELYEEHMISPDDVPTEAHWCPEWDESPEEGPGENAWIEENGSDFGDVLVFETEYDYRVEIACRKFADWQIDVYPPEEDAGWLFRKVFVKTNLPVEISDRNVGYADEVLMETVTDTIEGSDGTETIEFERPIGIRARVPEPEGMPSFTAEVYADDVREFIENSKEDVQQQEELFQASLTNDTD